MVELAIATPMDLYAAPDLIVAAGAATTVARLVCLRLAKGFPALLAYLLFLALINLGLGLLDPVSALYFWSYIVLEPLKCVFSVVAVRELLALAFNDYPGIRSLGRWVMCTGVALAVSISLLATGFFWNGGPHGRSADLFYFEVSQRSTVFSLAFVIVTILLFLSKYPLHLSRNTLVSSVFFSVLFLSEAAQLLVDSLAPKLYNVYVDWSGSVFVFICLVGWGAQLRVEPKRPPVRITLSTPREDYLLQQLTALNQMMTRSARR